MIARETIQQQAANLNYHGIVKKQFCFHTTKTRNTTTTKTIKDNTRQTQ